ncbi:hypothetical protein [Microbacterium panaciterrae]|uniref:Helix-turn-helix domain-containing protein n=1 Tax=Microbacterium panaciterrae TaxID=985759 RepID=A0ABP8P4A5_9MICO
MNEERIPREWEDAVVHRLADLLGDAITVLIEERLTRSLPTADGSEPIHISRQPLRIQEMVAESGLSRWTIMSALQRGELHGGQRLKRGTWHVEEPCFRAWMRGDECAHQRRGEANEGTPLKSRRR